MSFQTRPYAASFHCQESEPEKTRIQIFLFSTKLLPCLGIRPSKEPMYISAWQCMADRDKWRDCNSEISA